jgi:hypothetical protein
MQFFLVFRVYGDYSVGGGVFALFRMIGAAEFVSVCMEDFADSDA